MANTNTNTKSKNSEQKDFAPSVGLWPAKSGSEGYTCIIDEKVLQDLSKAAEGGVLYLSRVSDSTREKNERAPHYRIVILPPREGGFTRQASKGGEGF